jgi:hypothetical protein
VKWRCREPPASLLDRQQAFGYTQEDLRVLMSPMAVQAEEATGSMGNDSPLPVMSNKLKPLYSYFKQLFAQVTNPPIDPIREAMVMSLVSFIGPKPNLLDTTNLNPPMRLEVSPAGARFADMAKLRDIERAHRRQVQELRDRHLLSGGLGQGRRRSAPGQPVRQRGRCRADRLQHPDRDRPQDGRRTSRSRRCWPPRRSISIWSTRACAPPPAWSSKPARRAKCTTSRCSAATAPKRPSVSGDGNARERLRRACRAN